MQPPRATATTRWRCTTRRTCRPRTTTSRSTGGSTSVGRGRDRAHGQARHARVASGQVARAVGRLLARRRARRRAVFYLRGQRPGRGREAKRRAHAVVIDHLLPPMTRADTYDELAHLEQLFDEYAQSRRWTPQNYRSSANASGTCWGRGDRPRPRPRRRADVEEFDDLVLHVDGYSASSRTRRSAAACTRSAPPGADTLVDLVLAITRLPTAASLHCARPSRGSSASIRTHPRRSTRSRRARRQLVERAVAARGWSGRRRRPADAAVAARGWCRASRGPPTRSPTCSAGSTAVTCPAGPSGA